MSAARVKPALGYLGFWTGFRRRAKAVAGSSVMTSRISFGPRLRGFPALRLVVFAMLVMLKYWYLFGVQKKVPRPGIGPGRPESVTRLQTAPVCQFQHRGTEGKSLGPRRGFRYQRSLPSRLDSGHLARPLLVVMVPLLSGNTRPTDQPRISLTDCAFWAGVTLGPM